LARRLTKGTPLGPDGFVLDFIEVEDGIVFGGNDRSTRYAAEEFLSRHLGVRWLFPGPLGLEVQAGQDLIVPATRSIEHPAFSSRQISALNRPEERSWQERMRLDGKIEFHHRLHDYFPPETFWASKPGYFPMDHLGNRRRPTNDVGWQPCFSHPGSAQEVLRQSSEIQGSFSLGINDGTIFDAGGFCRCERCMADVPKELNRFGFEDFSTPYYRWVSSVAGAASPEQAVGLLAYAEVQEPPSEPLPVSVVPFLTVDRYRWVDPVRREAEQQWTQAWATKVRQHGIYEYVYGSYYGVPRLYGAVMADSLRESRAGGANAVFGDSQTSWAEGPKLHTMLKLWWNPNLDPEELSKAWCKSCLGEAAGLKLWKFYQFWESFWTDRVPSSAWFQRGRLWADFSTLDYLSLLTSDELDMLDEQLAEIRMAVEAEQVPRYVQRLVLLERAIQPCLLLARAWILDQSAWNADRSLEQRQRSLTECQNLIETRLRVLQDNEANVVTRTNWPRAHLWWRYQPLDLGAGLAWQISRKTIDQVPGVEKISTNFDEHPNGTLWEVRPESGTRVGWSPGELSLREGYGGKIGVTVAIEPGADSPVIVLLGSEDLELTGETEAPEAGRLIISAEWKTEDGQILRRGRSATTSLDRLLGSSSSFGAAVPTRLGDEELASARYLSVSLEVEALGDGRSLIFRNLSAELRRKP